MKNKEQNTFTPCGEGDNICNCKKQSECGYILIHSEIAKLNTGMSLENPKIGDENCTIEEWAPCHVDFCYQASSPFDRDCMIKCVIAGYNAYSINASRPKQVDTWISVIEEMPKPNTEVLVILDYRQWKKDVPLRIEKANVWHTIEPRPFGGPNALSGQGYLTGIYFSIPAVVHPDTVTHWMPLPENP